MDFNNLWSDIDLKSQKQNNRCLAINTILACKYLVGPVLGQGGFGITYLGYDLNMETRIAIKEYFPVELVSRDTTTLHGDKVLSLSGEKSETYQQGLKKYVAEAQNVSQFSEVPGVVSVKDFFYENETAYIVMEYIDGISLKDYLKEKGGRLSEEETLAIMKPVLEALEKVHNAGIIHRDISPDNIMLTFEDGSDINTVDRRGVNNGLINGNGTANDSNRQYDRIADQRKIKSVKLIDFGAARMTAKNEQKSLTIILKHGYAPEEQYRTHGEQGPWTDVYAVCAVMYRMLTGETPVPAMDRMFKDELKKFEQFETILKNNINNTTSTAIMKGLAVKKDDRIQSISEIIAALYDRKAVKTVDVGKKKTIYWISCICAVVLVGAILFVGYKLVGRSYEQMQNRLLVSAENTDSAENSAENPENIIKEPTNTTDDTSNEDDNTDENQVVYQMENLEEMQEVLIDTSVKDEVLGEQIVFYHPQRSISSTVSNVLFCHPDGTVTARGNNSNGQCEVEDWKNVAVVVAGDSCSIGIRTDGSVLVAGAMEASSDDYSSEVALWTDMVDIQVGEGFAIGLKNDGTVVAAGTYEAPKEMFSDLSEWRNVKAIAVESASEFFAIFGLTKDGSMLYSGNCSWVDSSKVTGITGWEDVMYLNARVSSNFIAGICENASLKVEAISENGETDKEWLMEAGQIIQLTGVIGVKADGTVYTEHISHNSLYDETVPAISRWTDLQAIAETRSQIFYGLKKDGTIIEYVDNQGNVTIEEMSNLEWIQELDSNANYFNIIARTKNGEVLSYGNKIDEREIAYIQQIGGKLKWYGTKALLLEDGTAVIQYDRIDHVVAGVKQMVELMHGSNSNGEFCCYVLLMEDGTVQVYNLGDINDKIEGYKTDFASAEKWTDVIQIEVIHNILYGLKSDGTLLYAGDVYKEPDVKKEKLKKISSGFYGVLLGITDSGKVISLLDSQKAAEKGMLQVESWQDIVDVKVGAYHTAGLCTDGTVVVTGSNYAGQCNVEGWKDIVYLAVGDTCTLGIDKDGKLWMAGTLY